MSKSNDNVITRGSSGTFGKQIVFSQRNGETIMGKPPKRSKVPPTGDQIAVREKFRTATDYAKAVNANPVLKAQYAAATKPGRSAYNTAFTDAFKASEVKEIDTRQYTGQPGSIVRIYAVDDFKVASVHLTILSQNGDVMEEGQAVTDPNSQYWIYTAISENMDLSGCTIKVLAKDLPGNVTVENQLL